MVTTRSSVSSLPDVTYSVSPEQFLVELKVSTLLNRAHLLALSYHRNADTAEGPEFARDLATESEALCTLLPDHDKWIARCNYIRGFISDVAGDHQDAAHYFIRAVKTDKLYRNLKRVEWCIENCTFSSQTHSVRFQTYSRDSAPSARGHIGASCGPTLDNFLARVDSAGVQETLDIVNTIQDSGKNNSATPEKEHVSFDEPLNIPQRGTQLYKHLYNETMQPVASDKSAEHDTELMGSDPVKKHDSQRIDVDAVVKSVAETKPSREAKPESRKILIERDESLRQDDTVPLPISELVRILGPPGPDLTANPNPSSPAPSYADRGPRAKRPAIEKGHQIPERPAQHPLAPSATRRRLSREEIRQSDSVAMRNLDPHVQEHVDRFGRERAESTVARASGSSLHISTKQSLRTGDDVLLSSPNTPSPLRKASSVCDIDHISISNNPST